MVVYPKHYKSNQNPVKPPQNSDIYSNMYVDKEDIFSKSNKVAKTATRSGESILNQMGPIGPKFGRGNVSNRSHKVTPFQNPGASPVFAP